MFLSIWRLSSRSTVTFTFNYTVLSTLLYYFTTIFTGSSHYRFSRDYFTQTPALTPAPSALPTLSTTELPFQYLLQLLPTNFPLSSTLHLIHCKLFIYLITTHRPVSRRFINIFKLLTSFYGAVCITLLFSLFLTVSFRLKSLKWNGREEK